MAQQLSSHELQWRAEEVHAGACRARMTPAQTVFGAFGAMVRNLAEEEGKQIEFAADGLEVQADRLVLQALKDPVMHLLRNAVSHGVEKPHERMSAGKVPAGEIRLRIESRGDRLRTTVEDDGKGLDTRALAQEAVQHGLMTKQAAEAATAEALTRIIFHAGVSTSKAVTQLAGRGLGLSIVAQAVTALHGDVRVRHHPKRGTRFIITVPLTISTQNILLVEERDQRLAIPVAAIDQLLRFRPRDVHYVNGTETIVVNEDPVPLARLGSLLQLPEKEDRGETLGSDERSMYQAVVLSSGDDRVAVIVDQLLDEREALIKESGLPRSIAGLSAGAIPLEDGSVAVMLNVGRLLQRHSSSGAAVRIVVPEKMDEKKPRLLVVDDSITTRSMEKSILEANGYEVSVAVDGVEALQAIRANVPQLIISDINMPRMDGFQLLEKLKSDPATSQIPVILVTSLERPEEQEKGLALGADAYILKRKFDQRELLQIVRQII
jgi:two-component system chemotaxis sensor kinase CheA